MATFRAMIKGTKNSVSRLGHKDIIATVDSWKMGVFVIGSKDDHGNIVFKIYETSGSGDRGFKSPKLIATVPNQINP